MKPCALLLLALVFACHRRMDDAPIPPPAVRVETVTRAGNAKLTIRGPVVAATRLRLGFKTGGVIGSVLVKAGTTVKKGQLLARLDASDAAAHHRAARAARDKAARDYRRATTLVDQGALASTARDDARSALESAEAALALATEAMKRTRIVAPIDGTVYKRIAEPGETIAAGAPVVIVEDTQRPTVHLGVTEADLRSLVVEQPATLLPEGQTPIAARITSLSTTPEPGDGLYTVEVTPIEPRALRVGALMTVDFELARDDAISVPLDAIVHRQDKDWLFIVDRTWDLQGKSPASVAMRPVVLGTSRGKRVLVVAGLQPGERFVSEGAYFLDNGQSVRVVDTHAHGPRE